MIDIDQAEKLWRQGVTGTAIARRLGMKMRSVYTLAESNRDRFPRRSTKVNAAGMLVLAAIERNCSEPTPYADRVTRVTSLGFRVTMPRVTFIDGPAA